jgi:hypothetical protein
MIKIMQMCNAAAKMVAFEDAYSFGVGNFSWDLKSSYGYDKKDIKCRLESFILHIKNELIEIYEKEKRGELANLLLAIIDCETALKKETESKRPPLYCLLYITSESKEIIRRLKSGIYTDKEQENKEEIKALFDEANSLVEKVRGALYSGWDKAYFGPNKKTGKSERFSKVRKLIYEKTKDPINELLPVF